MDSFDLSIQKEQLYGLIGPNGAGKTTVFNLLTGVYKPDTGKVILDGTDITGKKIIEINRDGIARTFQNIRLFKELTVLENVKVGLHNHHSYSTIEGILRLPRYRKVEREMDEKGMELLRGLSDYRMLIYAIVLIVMMLFNWAPKSIEWREKHLAFLKKKKNSPSAASAGADGRKEAR